jgi:protein TonB
MSHFSSARAIMAYYALPADGRLPLWRRSAALITAVGLHVFALLLIVGVATQPELAQPLQALTVRMLELAPTPPRVEPPKAKPPTPASPRKAPVAPPPIMTAAPAAAAAPQPEPRPVEIHIAPPAPPPIVAARFDADYLQNPKPVYPSMSRRHGEEGKVVLRVRVGVQGTSLTVEIKQSSGHPRLDEAARVAVEQWRFVPARQGSEAVESTVLVPLHFSLDN